MSLFLFANREEAERQLPELVFEVIDQIATDCAMRDWEPIIEFFDKIDRGDLNDYLPEKDIK